MANLEQKTRYVWLTIRKLLYPKDMDTLIKNYVESECERYTYIKHEGDINSDGLVEDTHYHLCLIYKENKRLSTRLNQVVDYFDFENANGIKIDKSVNQTANIQYLIHKNNKEKTQHDMSEIICNYNRDELKTILESELTPTITIDYLVSLCYENPNNRIVLMQKIGLNSYLRYRNVINDIYREIECIKARYRS